MRPILTLLLAGTWIAQSAPASADILRCASVLIEPGNPAAYALEKCGEPTSKMSISEPIWAQDASGNFYQAGTIQSELWRYNFGPNKFPAVLKVSQGVIQSIEFEKNWGQ